MILPQTIQQIVSRIDIIEIVGSFVKLKKRGSNYLGLCPFHNEKTPSFTVSPVKEIYKCFGCGRSGNTISFLMEHEKYSYVEALRWLAKKYGVDVEETNISVEQKIQYQVADSLYVINHFAEQYFSNTLFETDQGVDIGLSYLKERGFSEEIIRKFKIGYCLDTKDAFTKAALASQYNSEYLLKTGLVVIRDEKPMDNYRGRIIFPVHNTMGKIAGFGARVIRNNDKAPKYINTPENEIYSKSKILYGSFFARQAIDKSDECLLVEGYTDVIALHQAGIENVVASGGTSLTREQLRLVKKYTDNLTIVYDGDAAGVKAALRGLDIALEEALNVKLVLIPDNEDPDSYVKRIGAGAFVAFIAAHKQDFILFQLEVSLKSIGGDSHKKAVLVNQIAETISKINRAEDFTKQQDYIRKCAQLLGIEELGLLTLINKFVREKITKEQTKIPVTTEIVGDQQLDTDSSEQTFNLLFQDEMQERAVVKVLLAHGQKELENGKTIADSIFEEASDEDFFKNKKVSELITLYKSRMDAGSAVSIADFAYLEDNEMVQLVIESTNHPYEVSLRWNDENWARLVNKRIWELNYEDFQSQVLHNVQANELIYVHNIDDNYKNEAEDVLTYLKLKKIKRLMLLNEEDLKNPSLAFEKVIEYQKVHLHLKELQNQLSQRKGIVMYPF